MQSLIRLLRGRPAEEPRTATRRTNRDSWQVVSPITPLTESYEYVRRPFTNPPRDRRRVSRAATLPLIAELPTPPPSPVKKSVKTRASLPALALAGAQGDNDDLFGVPARFTYHQAKSTPCLASPSLDWLRPDWHQTVFHHPFTADDPAFSHLIDSQPDNGFLASV
jgi:hypothetical protein